MSQYSAETKTPVPSNNRSGEMPDRILGRPKSRREWRHAAHRLAQADRWVEAVALQRALVTTSRSASAREDLCDRFRLLRWEIAVASWKDSLEQIEAIYLRIAGRGRRASTAIGWIFLARAIAHFQLGWGTRFRKSLAAVLRVARRGPSRALAQAACEVALAYEEMRGDQERSIVSVLRNRIDSLAKGADAVERNRRDGLGGGLTGDPAREMAALLASPQGGGWVYRLPRQSASIGWKWLPQVLTGPPALTALTARAGGNFAIEGRLDDAVTGATGATDAADPANPNNPRPLWHDWLKQSETDPTLTVPYWVAPILARSIETDVPSAKLSLRIRLHQALANLASRIAEPYYRAETLAALAETSLWCIETVESGRSGERRARRYLAEARADLGLASGLLRRLRLDRRAEVCEDRWGRLARLGSGSGGDARVQDRSAQFTPGSGPFHPSTPTAAGKTVPFSLAKGRASGRTDLSLTAVRRRCVSAGFVTRDDRMLRELSRLILLAPTPLPILIGGESGTGKEVIARAVHRWSGLRGQFVAIHCGAIPRDLLESELFGHTRGAFTGAAADKAGLFEVADGGTLFLDEIGEMGTEAQMKMLRVLESGEVRRVGDLAPRTVKVRIVAATHRNLDEAVDRGEFRLDLLHRVRGVSARLFPLCERRGDILELAQHFLLVAGGQEPALRITENGLIGLLTYSWPGNVRELRSSILRATFLARALGREEIGPALLGLPATDGSQELPPDLELPEMVASDSVLDGDVSPDAVQQAGLETILEAMERRLILQALEENGWNRTRTARRLGGLSRTTLISKMKRLGLRVDAPMAAS